jgi:hypothetical protein
MKYLVPQFDEDGVLETQYMDFKKLIDVMASDGQTGVFQTISLKRSLKTAAESLFDGQTSKTKSLMRTVFKKLEEAAARPQRPFVKKFRAISAVFFFRNVKFVKNSDRERFASLNPDRKQHVIPKFERSQDMASHAMELKGLADILGAEGYLTVAQETGIEMVINLAASARRDLAVCVMEQVSATMNAAMDRPPHKGCQIYSLQKKRLASAAADRNADHWRDFAAVADAFTMLKSG